MSMKKTRAVGFAVAVLTGCASIVNHSPNPVSITSFPDRAHFTVTNQQGRAIHGGTTPETLVLRPDAGYFRGEHYTLTFQKDGFGTQTTPLRAQLNSWYWGNVVLGGLFGMLIVDPLTGAMWALPEEKSVYLVPNP